LLNQAAGILIAWVLAGIGSYIILKIVDAIIGLRVNADDEIMGLDLSQHGEEGYNM
jgi:Amt family ammonium transporter